MERFNDISKRNHASQEAFQNKQAYLRAEKKIKELKGFYIHAFVYVVVNVFLCITIIVNSQGDIWNFGLVATPLFWGLGLGIHALIVFGENLFFYKSWEERKIKHFMKEEEKLNKF